MLNQGDPPEMQREFRWAVATIIYSRVYFCPWLGALIFDIYCTDVGPWLGRVVSFALTSFDLFGVAQEMMAYFMESFQP